MTSLDQDTLSSTLSKRECFSAGSRHSARQSVKTPGYRRDALGPLPACKVEMDRLDRAVYKSPTHRERSRRRQARLEPVLNSLTRKADSHGHRHRRRRRGSRRALRRGIIVGLSVSILLGVLLWLANRPGETPPPQVMPGETPAPPDWKRALGR